MAPFIEKMLSQKMLTSAPVYQYAVASTGVSTVIVRWVQAVNLSSLTAAQVFIYMDTSGMTNPQTPTYHTGSNLIYSTVLVSGTITRSDPVFWPMMTQSGTIAAACSISGHVTLTMFGAEIT